MRWALVIAAGACGRLDFDPQPRDAATGGVDAGATGGGTIAGSGCPATSGTMFQTVGSVWSVGNVEYPNETTILVFDRAITCAYLSTGTSWDDAASATIPNGTQFLRLSLDGGDPRTYALAPTDPPAAGSHAGVAAYYQTIAPGTSSLECFSSAGTVVITAGGAGTAIAGQLDVMLQSAGTLTGTFTAAWCGSGWYP